MSASLLLFASLVLGFQDLPEAPVSPAAPRTWHIGSYESSLGARWSVDGSLDTGAALLQLVDGTTGRPIEAHRADYGKGPSLGVQWRARLGELKLSGYVLASDVASQGDRRLAVAEQVAVYNPTSEAQDVRLEVRVRPGSNEAHERPWPSTRFASDEVWGLQDAYVTRGGQAVVSWVGTPPLVELAPAPDEPFGLAARLIYQISVPAGAEARFEFKAAGAPVTGTLAETSWRARFARVTWGRLDDDRRWESDFHGQFGALQTADPRMRDVLVTAVHVLRSFGEAHGGIERLSDQPFGQPAGDAATEAQILGLLFEFGFEDIGLSYLDQLLGQVYERAGALPLERKLAYLHGLARAVRLGADGVRDIPLADAIVALLDGGGPEGWSESWPDAGVAVEPWLDPEHVRADLAVILERAGIERDQPLPRFVRGETGGVPVLAEMQAVSRALAEGDPEAAWGHYSNLLGRTSARGAGATVDGACPDGAFAQGIASLGRALLFDDHGADLVLFPGVATGLLTEAAGVETAWMPTRFGLLKEHGFHTGARLVGGWVHLAESHAPGRILMRFPSDIRIKSVKPKPVFGTVEVLGEHVVQLFLDEPKQRGMRFTLRAAKGAGAADDVTGDDADGAGDDAGDDADAAEQGGAGG